MPSAPSRPRLLTGWEGWRCAPLISSRFRPRAPPAADVVEAADAVEVVEGVRLCGLGRPVSGRRIEQNFDEQAKCAGPRRTGTSCSLERRACSRLQLVPPALCVAAYCLPARNIACTQRRIPGALTRGMFFVQEFLPCVSKGGHVPKKPYFERGARLGAGAQT